MASTGLRLAVGWGMLASLGACTDELPPLGEVILVVDTDLPVPTFASRLRVDVYSPDGVWYASRDIARRDPRDWPVSFSVVSPDDRGGEVLVRLRAYVDGKIRDYHGERYEGPVSYDEPFVATDMETLCAEPVLLPLGGTVTLRRGDVPFIGDLLGDPSCVYETLIGSVAARLEIETEELVRVGVVDTFPFQPGLTGPTFQQVTLQIRRECADAETAVACESGIANNQSSPAVVSATLEPGHYVVVTGGSGFEAPTDITIAAAKAAQWQDPWPLPPPTPLPQSSCVPPPDAVLLSLDGAETPAHEPEPTITVDRLVRLTVEPGRVRQVGVTLRGACVGTMAKLGEGCPVERPDFNAAQTCIDTAGLRVPPPVESGGESAIPESTQLGTFPVAEPCSADLEGNVAACIPGGLFNFGDRSAWASAGPNERVARMPRFWMDRHEVTVARFRDAVASGFEIVFGPGTVRTNDAPLAEPGPINAILNELCTWSTAPMGREDYALSCISWNTARSFCQFQGGDLATEAEWEYAAIAAGRPGETLYPWGSVPPTCDRIAVGRFHSANDPVYGSECYDGSADSFGPLPVSARPGDASLQGVIGMSGGVSEWSLDSFRTLADACWRSQTLTSPRCWEEHAPMRSYRGAHFMSHLSQVVAGVHLGTPPHAVSPLLGLRCVYHDGPR